MPHTIAENLARLQTARTNIANAITTMGGTVASGDGFEEFPSEILGIPVGTSSGAAYYTTFPVTSSTTAKLGFGIIGNKGEQGTIFVAVSGGANPGSSTYNTIQLNNFNLSDYLTQNVTVAMYRYTVSGISFNITFNIQNNTLILGQVEFLQATSGQWTGFTTGIL